MGLRWCGSIRALPLPGITKENPKLSSSSNLDVMAQFLLRPLFVEAAGLLTGGKVLIN